MKLANVGLNLVLISRQQPRAPGGATIALMLLRIPDQ